MKNKHAYLIMAHDQFKLLELLCKMIDHPQHDIYLHVDIRSKGFDDTAIRKELKYSKLFCINRTKAVWGAYSLVNCEIQLLKSSLTNGNYSYFHLLSGSDLLLKRPDEIYDFFESSGKEFLYRYSDDDSWQYSVKRRVSLYFFFREKVGKCNNIFRALDKLSTTAQEILCVNRKKKFKTDYILGSQWFSITNELVEYIVQNEKFIKKHFRYTNCPDEVFLLMLIENTEFMDKLYDRNGDMGFAGNMRYIDWRRGKPYTFTDEDYDALINSDRMFARKFDIENHPEICYKIFNHSMGADIQR